MPPSDNSGKRDETAPKWWQRDVTRFSMILSASVCTLISVCMIIQVCLFGLEGLEASSSVWLSGTVHFARSNGVSGGGPGLGFAIFPFLSWLLWWAIPPTR